jgi:hypothetical protein
MLLREKEDMKDKTMPNRDDFQAVLDELFAFSNEKGLSAITVRAGELHRLVGAYPGKDHRMPICCTVMRDFMHPGDEIVSAPPKGDGASLEIRYIFQSDAQSVRRVYEEVRALVEGQGGSMQFERKGYRWGAWIIRLAGLEGKFPSNGAGFPSLDQLYSSSKKNPSHWSDYDGDILPDAEARLMALLQDKKD